MFGCAPNADLLVKRFGAKRLDSVVGPYFLMTHFAVATSNIAFIEDDAEGYPLAMTSNDFRDEQLFDSIAEALRAEFSQ